MRNNCFSSIFELQNTIYAQQVSNSNQKSGMNTQKWTLQIDDTTAAFKKAFGQLSDEQLNLKPNSSTWSIGQNIEHLIAVNESYFRLLNAYGSKFTQRHGWPESASSPDFSAK
jgi:hypothetical protein